MIKSNPDSMTCTRSERGAEPRAPALNLRVRWRHARSQSARDRTRQRGKIVLRGVLKKVRVCASDQQQFGTPAAQCGTAECRDPIRYRSHSARECHRAHHAHHIDHAHHPHHPHHPHHTHNTHSIPPHSQHPTTLTTCLLRSTVNPAHAPPEEAPRQKVMESERGS